MLKIAACQMTSGIDFESNLLTAEKLIRRAALRGCYLAVLPEMFAIFTGSRRELAARAEEFGAGPIQDRMAALAKSLGIWIAAGSIPLKTENPDLVSNTTLVWDAWGNQAARYDKVHLFAFDGSSEKHDERYLYQPGKQPVSFILPLPNGSDIRIGLAICYDLRFPEHFRALNKPDLILLPSAFTVPTGQAHWRTLLRARAIENLCYVCAPAQAGTNQLARSFWGHSMIVDPWGQVLAQMDQNETGLITSEVNLQRIAQLRSLLPALSNA